MADDVRLRTFWNDRYAQFSLSESGWMGAGEALNARIYACKLQALDRALAARGLSRASRFHVLDAGCGQGFFANHYREAFPFAGYVGVDISERAIAHVRETVAGAECYTGDLSTWTDPARRRFDIIQSLEVLHLILDDEIFAGALARFAEQLGDGGAMLLTAALPDETVQRHDYLRYRSRRLWLETLGRLGLRIVDRQPIYYWLPSGGPANRYARWAFARLGATALYAVDRAAFAAGLPRPPSVGIDSRMQLLTIERAHA